MPVEADDGVDLDPHGFVEVDADAAQNVDELRMRADAGAAAGEVLGVALEHDGVPAGAAQEMRRQQSAERAADHQDASRGHRFNERPASGHGPRHAVVAGLVVAVALRRVAVDQRAAVQRMGLAAHLVLHR